MGEPKEFLSSVFEEVEILLGEPWKAERTPVPGAGFSPEAVPSKWGPKERFKEPAADIKGLRGRKKGIAPVLAVASSRGSRGRKEAEERKEKLVCV